MNRNFITDKTCSNVRLFKFIPENKTQIKNLQRQYNLANTIDNIEVEINKQKHIGVMLNDVVYVEDKYYIYEEVICVLRINCEKTAYVQNGNKEWVCDEHIT